MSNIYTNGELDARKVAAEIAADCINNEQIYDIEQRMDHIQDDVEAAICEIRRRGDEESIDNIADVVKCFRRDRFFELIQGIYEEAGFGERAAINFARNYHDWIDDCVNDGSTDDDAAGDIAEDAKEAYDRRAEEVRDIVIRECEYAMMPDCCKKDLYNDLDSYVRDVIARDTSDDKLISDMESYVYDETAEWWTNRFADIKKMPEYAIIKQAREEHEAQIPDDYVEQRDIAHGNSSGDWTIDAIIHAWVLAGTPQSWIDTLTAINTGK